MVPPQSVQEHIFDVFVAQIEAFPTLALTWLNNVLQQLPTDIVTINERQKFIAFIGTMSPGESEKNEYN